MRVRVCVWKKWREGDSESDSSDDLTWQVQVEDEKSSHGNLLSIGRMLSLPSDGYNPPVRSSPYPPIGLEAYASYSYSGIVVVYQVEIQSVCNDQR